MSALVEARHVSQLFTRQLDAAEKLARLIGARVREETVHAVDGVDLAVHAGEIVGLVGESGCGKSTLGRILAGIRRPSGGEVLWEGQPIAAQPPDQAKRMRLSAQMIFQDPMSTLNPRKRVIELIGEAPRVHGLEPRASIRDYVAETMRRVGLDPDFIDRYPHQFSGGQRQRIGIARALAVKPRLIICDESVAALDVSIQAQILNLFMELKTELGLTYVFISHDLGVVKHLCDRVAIMYLGRIVETADAENVFGRPNHPYTMALLRELPDLKDRRRTFVPIRGEIPSPLSPPSGCHFHPRCPHAFERCRLERPALREVAPGHRSACHLNDRAGPPAATRKEEIR